MESKSPIGYKVVRQLICDTITFEVHLRNIGVADVRGTQMLDDRLHRKVTLSCCQFWVLMLN